MQLRSDDASVNHQPNRQGDTIEKDHENALMQVKGHYYVYAAQSLTANYKYNLVIEF